jgi:hypothetical protein
MGSILTPRGEKDTVLPPSRHSRMMGISSSSLTNCLDEDVILFQSPDGMITVSSTTSRSRIPSFSFMLTFSFVYIHTTPAQIVAFS